LKKKPFATSFIVPSPPIATTFLNPFFKNSLVSVVPSPGPLVNTTSRGVSPKSSFIFLKKSYQPLPVNPLEELGFTTKRILGLVFEIFSLCATSCFMPLADMSLRLILLFTEKV
jgi:hypothetical protein